MKNLSPVRTDSVYWIQVPTGNGLLRAAIATPTGPGPFPAVVMLHGTHGFAEEYVYLARRIARKGMVGIAVCWFAGLLVGGERAYASFRPSTAPTRLLSLMPQSLIASALRVTVSTRWLGSWVR